MSLLNMYANYIWWRIEYKYLSNVMNHQNGCYIILYTHVSMLMSDEFVFFVVYTRLYMTKLLFMIYWIWIFHNNEKLPNAPGLTLNPNENKIHLDMSCCLFAHSWFSTHYHIARTLESLFPKRKKHLKNE